MASFEDSTRILAEKVIEQLKKTPAEKRIVIGVAGVPGSGKTTIAAAVCLLINQHFDAACSTESEQVAIALPMDGFHYSRAHLAVMPDPAVATYRRGAAFTFDAPGFYKLIQRLTDPDERQTTITAPSFDHAIKDPEFDSLVIKPAHRVVLVEGNYCALNREPWSDAAKLMTELWYVDVAREVAWDRLAKRHLASGVVKDEAEAIDRARSTDELNAEDIRQNLLPINERVFSV